MAETTFAHIHSDWASAGVDTGPNHVFALGDIHGHLDAFEAALGVIHSIPKMGTSELVQLGDLVDRGPRSIGCLKLMLEGAAEMASVDRRIFVPGNHEIMMLEALAEPIWGNFWLRNGGASVCLEMGIPLDDYGTIEDPRMGIQYHGLEAPFRELQDAIEQALGGQYREILLQRSHHRAGGLLFVHAGIDPRIEIESFLAADAFDGKHDEHWAWIRDGFTLHEGAWNAQDDLVVVHGHTPVHTDKGSSAYRVLPSYMTARLHDCDMLETRRRINLDANCGKSGKTVAIAEFWNGQYRLHLVA